MKKIILSMTVVALIFATSCKKESSETIDNKEVSTVDETVTNDQTELEIAYNDAVIKLEEAKKSGDVVAQVAAQEAVDKAKSSWEAIKMKTNEISSDLKEGAEAAGDKIDAAADKAKTDMKKTTEKANESINKAKQDAAKAAEKAKIDAAAAKENAKQGYNNTLDKMKAK